MLEASLPENIMLYYLWQVQMYSIDGRKRNEKANGSISACKRRWFIRANKSSTIPIWRIIKRAFTTTSALTFLVKIGSFSREMGDVKTNAVLQLILLTSELKSLFIHTHPHVSPPNSKTKWEELKSCMVSSSVWYMWRITILIHLYKFWQELTSPSLVLMCYHLIHFTWIHLWLCELLHVLRFVSGFENHPPWVFLEVSSFCHYSICFISRN